MINEDIYADPSNAGPAYLQDKFVFDLSTEGPTTDHYSDVIMGMMASQITSRTPLKLRVTSLRAGNSPGTSEFPAQMVSNAENVSN